VLLEEPERNKLASESAAFTFASAQRRCSGHPGR
jgi:hypothetical protein